MKITRKSLGDVTEAVLTLDVRKATVYLDEQTVVKATAQRRAGKRDRSVTIILTAGRPNFEERKFLKDCKRAGEPLPVRKVQLKHWPKKR